MSNNLKDILANLNKDIEQDKLLQYLDNQLPESDKHAVETNLNDDAFMSDAMDGLQQLENKSDIPSIVNQLNTGLKKQLDKRKQRKNKRAIAEQPWVYYTIVLLLVLVVVAYIVIKKMSS